MRYLWVGVCSLCIKYAWLCVSEYVWEPRMSTSVHWHPTFISRMNSTRLFQWHPLTVAKRACLEALHQWFMRQACYKCLWNTTTYLLVCLHVRDMSVIVNETCIVHAWFMCDSLVISVPDTPKIWSISQCTSTHKPNLCVIREWFVRDRMCD